MFLVMPQRDSLIQAAGELRGRSSPTRRLYQAVNFCAAPARESSTTTLANVCRFAAR
jgi:hypothetical protein